MLDFPFGHLCTELFNTALNTEVNLKLNLHFFILCKGQLTFSADLDGNPKLWCALSCGKVVVFDAVSWSLLQNCIDLGDSQLVRLIQDTGRLMMLI